jgi:hypothetical protein
MSATLRNRPLRTISRPAQYVTRAPHPQNALDILKGEWISRLPEPYTTMAGTAGLFNDHRIRWAENELGGFRGKRILDLGPLEGGHPYMFEKGGAERVVSIEANTRSFLKCLITKELLGLQRVSYQCGDFMEFLRGNRERFDIVNASGVLYHQRNPAELLALVAAASDAVIIWTHYYDDEIASSTENLHRMFSGWDPQSYDGFEYRPHRRDYLEAVHVPYFCGGTASYAHWMLREDILRCLKHFGLDDIRVSFEVPGHVNGPSFALVAVRRGASAR